MKLKNKCLTSVLGLGAGIILCSCSFSNNNASAGGPDQLTVICENLKQDIILNDGISPANANGPSPTKAASYYQQYDQYNCDDVISGKSGKTVKPTS